MKRWITMIFCVMTLTLALSGCTGEKSQEDSSQIDSSSQEQSEPTQGGEIVVGIPQDLEDSLDPHKAEAAGTREILFNIFEGLVKPDENGDLVDAVAGSHEVSEDGRTYTFTLREGIKFHNGADVTVADVKYSIDRCAEPSGGAPLVSAFSNIQEVAVPDDRTVVITLKEADTEFLAYLTTAIIPADNADPDTNPIGTGPFKYVSRSPQENIIVEKNTEYWGTPAYLDRVTFKILADGNTVVTNLKGGSADMSFHLNSTQVAELSEGFRIYEGTMNLVQALYLNNDVKPFDNVKVRQAMSYATDAQMVMDMIADGKGTAIGSSIFPSFGKYFLPELADMYTQDINKAKELMAEAGYADGFDMTITVPSNYQPHIDTAQVLVEQLKQININAEIELIEWDSWLNDVYGERKYESTVVGVDASVLTARALLERFTSDADDNFINFSNEEYDQLFEEVKVTTDDAKQVELYKRMEEILAEESANVYIQDMADFVALNENFDGYTFYPLYALDMSKVYAVKK